MNHAKHIHNVSANTINDAIIAEEKMADVFAYDTRFWNDFAPFGHRFQGEDPLACVPRPFLGSEWLVARNLCSNRLDITLGGQADFDPVLS